MEIEGGVSEERMMEKVKRYSVVNKRNYFFRIRRGGKKDGVEI